MSLDTGASQRPRPTCREPGARPHRRRGGPWSSTTTPPRWLSHSPAWHPAGRSCCPAANWSRSAVRSGFRTSSRQAARVWSRSVRRTAPRLGDYERAIRPGVSLVLKVYPSNYRIQGFVEEVDPPTLAGLRPPPWPPAPGRRGQAACCERSRRPPLSRHQSFQDLIEAGCDLVCGSGDKLLGGPQAGLIAGRESIVARLRESPPLPGAAAGKAGPDRSGRGAPAASRGAAHADRGSVARRRRASSPGRVARGPGLAARSSGAAPTSAAVPRRSRRSKAGCWPLTAPRRWSPAGSARGNRRSSATSARAACSSTCEPWTRGDDEALASAVERALG